MEAHHKRKAGPLLDLFFVIAFEGCILGGVLATVIGMIVKNRLFHFHLPEGYDPRFSQDQFGLFVICPEAGYARGIEPLERFRRRGSPCHQKIEELLIQPSSVREEAFASGGSCLGCCF